MAGSERVLRELTVVHSIELALVQTLTAHVAVTPRGAYRELLERHLGETRRQATAIQRRTEELGVARNPLQVAVGAAEAVVGQALALGKAPLDLLRGSSAEEKLLKNARDEATSEMLEIASYDALEALADEVGDEATATLAREHRAEEERTLSELRELIPGLARDVISAELRGQSTYDVASTGAADAVRAATRLVFGDRGTPEPTAPAGSAGPADPAFPIAGYESLPAVDVLPRLYGLSPAELAQVDAYEREHRGRKRILERIRQLQDAQMGNSPPDSGA
jgi:ferritin-like metal-binding protein YciE